MLPSDARIYVATAPIDMRRSFDGLAAAVSERMQLDPQSGALFVFANVDMTRIKVRVEALAHGALTEFHSAKATLFQQRALLSRSKLRYGTDSFEAAEASKAQAQAVSDCRAVVAKISASFRDLGLSADAIDRLFSASRLRLWD